MLLDWQEYGGNTPQHRHIADTAFRFRSLNYILHLRCSLQLVVYLDTLLVELKIGDRQPAELRDSQPRVKENIDRIVVSAEMLIFLDEFQKIVLSIVSKIIIPILPFFIGLTFCGLAYEGSITKQLPVFLKVIVIVLIGHFIWMTLLYVLAGAYSHENPWEVVRHYGPAYLTAVGTMSSRVQTRQNHFAKIWFSLEFRSLPISISAVLF